MGQRHLDPREKNYFRTEIVKLILQKNIKIAWRLTSWYFSTAFKGITSLDW